MNLNISNFMYLWNRLQRCVLMCPWISSIRKCIGIGIQATVMAFMRFGCNHPCTKYTLTLLGINDEFASMPYCSGYVVYYIFLSPCGFCKSRASTYWQRAWNFGKDLLRLGNAQCQTKSDLSILSCESVSNF